MTYVRNAWYVAAWAHEVVADRPVGVRVLNEPIVLWRNAAGALAAFEDRCIHRLAPLSLGRCEGEKLRCMYHGLLYDRSGQVVEIPGQEKLPSRLRVRPYPVVERHGWVWVWMGEAAAADEGLIPPVMGLDHPDYLLGHGQLDFAAAAHLVNENLLDLSHVSFLHASLQFSEAWARQPPKFTKHERSVRTEWWMRNESLKPGERVDMYTRSDFYVPGVLVVTDRGYPLGTADKLNGQEPNLEPPPFNIFIHLISPMTERSTRYFYCAGSHRGHGEDAVRARDSLMGLAEKAFAEDKMMIEAQQQSIDSTPGWRFIPTINDRGVMLFKQIVEKLAREESTRSSQRAGAEGRADISAARTSD